LAKLNKKFDKTIKKVEAVSKVNKFLVLYEIVWVIELQFTAGKIDHIYKVGSISVSSGSFFC
jgi:hypothetical protein